jgi:hypothetical protein
MAALRPKSGDTLKPIGAEYPVQQPSLRDLPPVDARTAMQIAGVPVSTINVWINRGIIPGVGVGSQGRARSFDIDLVVHIAIMGVLVRLGYGAPFASWTAVNVIRQRDLSEPALLLVIGPSDGLLSPLPRPMRFIKNLNELGADDPEGYTLVDIARIVARVRQAVLNSSEE